MVRVDAISKGDTGPPPAKRATAQRIAASQELKLKAVNYRTGFSLSPSGEELESLEQVIANSVDLFRSEVARGLRQMRKSFAAAGDGTRSRKSFLQVARAESYMMKGLGGTFGYPLLTQIAKSMNRFVTALETLDDRQLFLAGLHIRAIDLVFTDEIQGPGGRLEQEVVEGFFAATSLLMKRSVSPEEAERRLAAAEEARRKAPPASAMDWLDQG